MVRSAFMKEMLIMGMRAGMIRHFTIRYLSRRRVQYVSRYRLHIQEW